MGYALGQHVDTGGSVAVRRLTCAGCRAQGDLLEGLEFSMVNADEPTVDHIRKSFKLDRAVRSLRRYAWNARQLLQELRQDNFGVIPKATVKMMTSVERNTENITEVASAYVEQCDGIKVGHTNATRWPAQCRLRAAFVDGT